MWTFHHPQSKACSPDSEKVRNWPEHIAHAFFADCISVRSSTDVSPYYTIHGIEPLLPFDLTEAILMSNNYRTGLSTAELIVECTRQLEKQPEDIQKIADTLRKHQIQSKEQFEQRYEMQLV